MRRVLRLINEVSLGVMLGTLAGAVVVFAVAYWLLTVSGLAPLVPTYTDGEPGFLDALYFSVVTISSLGYGDIRPVGLARLLAAGEVVLGLSFFGLIVAKISSVKQDYILRRLYSDKVEGELDEFIETLDNARELYRVTSGLLLHGEIDPSLTTTFRADVPEVTMFYQLRQTALDVQEFMAFEVGNQALFGDVPDHIISRLYASWQDILAFTLHLWETDPDRACDLVLCGNGRWITQIADLCRDMAEMGLRESRDDGIRTQCRALLQLARKVEAEVVPHL